MDEAIQNLQVPIPPAILNLSNEPDGARRIVEALLEMYPPAAVEQFNDQLGVWVSCGNAYKQSKRFHEAMIIYLRLYDRILEAQDINKTIYHKGLPLVWIQACFYEMNMHALAKRYMMLTLCEDAIHDKGIVNPQAGVYFRLVWFFGLPHDEVYRYYREVYSIYQSNPPEYLYPERILQEIDDNWMMEYPSAQESAIYMANCRYINGLIAHLGDPSGKTLELLSSYILSCIPGFKVKRSQRCKGFQYDIICTIEGPAIDFRSELGRYIICECKDWEDPADITIMAKFCRVLDSTKSKFGILFSKNGITGQNKTTAAEREQLKVFQDRGMVIIVIDENDLKELGSGRNFVSLLRAKYEAVRLDLRPNF